MEKKLEILGHHALQILIWLVVQNWCWMANRLAKQGLPHPEVCPLCDQAEETTSHLVGCVCSPNLSFDFQLLGLVQ
jgi:hypothetical protein